MASEARERPLRTPTKEEEEEDDDDDDEPSSSAEKLSAAASKSRAPRSSGLLAWTARRCAFHSAAPALVGILHCFAAPPL